MANWDHKSNIGTHELIDEPGVGNHNDALVGLKPPRLSTDTETHVPAGSLVTVTIGRNVSTTLTYGNAVPLDGVDWTEFRNQVRQAFIGRASAVFGPFDGTGEWEGVTEESAVFTAIVDRPFSVDVFDNELGQLAKLYGQDAIGWAFGTGRLASL